ncbi:hypothetical protein SAMN05444671_0671 [Flavobacterium sp. CF108]|jgi:hypothetical protein|uniref:hypothetical protein n=1 Tax=unclassified Flavobacterium TaxID=196869 RepID=UPI0008B989A4|nr:MULTISPECIES: hypothetical protein [unclassified Flavobacterium]SEO21179.1 hypothetical protein SAMN04487978_2407 [Flavobacterium sp. fv08]SHG51893.1 hypothetical protein SAMN05444671_0671 [Flavobacterium sp. CF108]
MIISVYKTDVNTKSKLRKVKPVLNRILLGVKWNFDLDDCDKILRVESDKSYSEFLIAELHKIEVYCEELF